MRNRKAESALGVLLGLLLVALNAAVLFLVFYVNPYPWIGPDLGLLSRQSETILLIQDALPCFGVFCCVGVLCGYLTGTLRSPWHLSVTAGLIGAPSIIVLALIFVFVLGGEEGLYLIAFVFDGEGILAALLLALLVMGGGVVGGVLGSRVLRPVALLGGPLAFRLVLGGLVVMELASLVLGGYGFVGQGPLAFLSSAVVEFAVPTPQSGPSGITAGSDGNLWFTESGANQIGRITPGGTITEFNVPTADARPAAITAGPDHALWFAETDHDQIGRISLSGSVTEFPLYPPVFGDGPSGVAAITASPDGNLWVTQDIGSVILRITPDGTVNIFYLNFEYPDANPGGMTVGPDRNLWFTDQGNNEIGWINPSGAITLFPVPSAQSDPLGITAGPDGNLWFTEAGSNQIGRIAPRGLLQRWGKTEQENPVDLFNI